MATQPVPGQEQPKPDTASASANTLHDLCGELEITGAAILEEHWRVYATITPEMWAVIERMQRVENTHRSFQPGRSLGELLEQACEVEASARRSRRRYELERPR